ncbi:hypothetical protein JL101_035780 (plasmid) [Skermanella rosea]|uniref:hypothetical protein n=1 Tax=Skermanella rosea TaxID=1817965 RepID=UPI001931A948|nr:hypothetical protein [Skermanella rosea]UEM08013.1 hypothetical protein JL101_035780 [Skermanella rosea]
MPKRNEKYRPFDPARARRILRLVGMTHEEFRLLLNQKTRSNVLQPNVSAWMSGSRPLPDAAVLLLKWLVSCGRDKRNKS